MKTRVGFAIFVLSILSQSGVGQALQPDRIISVISMERYENATSKGYKVEAKTSGSQPNVYYRLDCGLNAADLGVGQLYRAAEAKSGQSKILVIFLGHSDAKDWEIFCDIEKESITRE